MATIPSRSSARAVFSLRLVWLLSACLAPAAAPATERTDDAVAVQVERAIRPLLSEHGVPGIAVAATAAGRSYFFNFGVASKADGTPVTARTLFEIGSVSKTFTATLTGYAVATGKLALDDHPSRFLPDLRDRPIDAPTLRELGTYTAGGLPLQFPDDVTDEAGMLAFFRNWRPTSPPGTHRQYSNPSIGLVGRVAATALGCRFSECMEGVLLPKLGLRSTYVHVPDRALADYAWGYNGADQPVRVNPGVLDAEAYGIKSSATDMLRFVELNLQPETAGPALSSVITATQIGYVDVSPMVQGLGWEQYSDPVNLETLLVGNATDMTMRPHAGHPLGPEKSFEAARFFNKTGSTNGFGAYVAFAPTRRAGVVILMNKNAPIPARIRAAHAILEAVAPSAP